MFANVLGQRELPRLHELAGEVRYRVPPPGAIIRDGQLEANVAFPGLTIRYTTDGSEPTPTSAGIRPCRITPQPKFRLRAFDAHGHGSRTIEVRFTKA